MSTAETTTDQWLPPEEAAETLNVSRTTIIRMCKDGQIPSVQARGQWRVRADYIDHLPSPYREKVAA